MPYLFLLLAIVGIVLIVIGVIILNLFGSVTHGQLL